MRYITAWLVLILLSGIAMSASAQNVRKYSNEFLNVGIGARGLAMANAQVASSQDLYAGYYNPAGLARIEDNFQLGYMHSAYFANIAQYDYAGIVVPLKDEVRTVGLSMIRLGVDDIPNTLELFELDGQINYDNVKRFSVAEYAFLFHYAQKINVPGLTVGGNVKIIHKKIGPFATAWGFGLDAGVQYRRNNWFVGFTARDITSTYNAWSFSFTEEEQATLIRENNVVPENSLEITAPMLLFGAAYEASVKDKFYILPEINMNLNTDGRRNVLIRTDPVSFDFSLGLELNYMKIVYVRAGIGNFQWKENDDEKDVLLAQPNLGIGLNIKGFHIDYAFTNVGETEVFYSNVISVHLALNKKPNKGE